MIVQEKCRKAYPIPTSEHFVQNFATGKHFKFTLTIQTQCKILIRVVVSHYHIGSQASPSPCEVLVYNYVPAHVIEAKPRDREVCR